MNRFPSPPIVSAALSGFVIGVIVALAASGVLARPSAARQVQATPSTPVPVKSVRDEAMESQLARLANRVLGPDPAGPKSRFLGVQVTNVSTLDLGLVPAGTQHHYRSVMLTFRLNDHPLGPTWRLREAKADVFALMKSLYMSGLPVYNAELIGKFSKGSQHSYDAIIAYMTFQTAEKIPWKRWGRTHEGQLWSMLDYQSIDRRFA
jgi:hypothetical protein